MVGPMSLQFPKQLRASGNKTMIVGGGTNYDEFALPFMGDEVIGDVSALHYSAALQTPANEEFVKKYRAKYGKVPSYYSEVNYATAKWIDLTLAKFKGKYPGPVEFIKAMATIKLDAPRGPVTARSRHQEPDPEHLHQEGREEEDVRLRERRTLEHGDQDLSGGRASSGPMTRRRSSSSRSIRAISHPANSANRLRVFRRSMIAKPGPTAGAYAFAHELFFMTKVSRANSR